MMATDFLPALPNPEECAPRQIISLNKSALMMGSRGGGCVQQGGGTSFRIILLLHKQQRLLAVAANPEGGQV